MHESEIVWVLSARGPLNSWGSPTAEAMTELA